MSANPYDRRRGPRQEWQSMGLGSDAFASGPLAHGRPATPLDVHDLEAMVYSAFMRGRQQDAERHFEEVQAEKRKAWDEGHATGQEDGHAATLGDVERLHGPGMRDVQARALEVLSAVNADPRKVTKSDLVAMLDEAQVVLTAIANSHELGFRVFE